MLQQYPLHIAATLNPDSPQKFRVPYFGVSVAARLHPQDFVIDTGCVGDPVRSTGPAVKVLN